jgi:hypothetical protein
MLNLLKKVFIPAFGAASLVVLPFWMIRFEHLGIPTDASFVQNHFYVPAGFARDYVASILLLFALTALFYLSHRLLSNRTLYRHWVLGLVTIGLWCFALNGLRNTYGFLTATDIKALYTSGMVVAIFASAAMLAVLYYLIRFFPFVLSTAQKTLSFAAIFGVLGVANSILATVLLNNTQPWTLSAKPDTSAAATSQSDSKTVARVVWVLFDELDQVSVFQNRDPSVSMPNFDELAAGAFTAWDARAPAIATRESVPSLLMGRVVETAVPVGRRLKFKFKDSDIWEYLSDHPSIYKDLQARGLSTSVLVQDHQGPPYCRTLYQQIRRCWEVDHWFKGYPNYSARVVFVASELFWTLPILYRYSSSSRNNIWYSVETFKNFRAEAFQTLKNSRETLNYLHWMLPHNPYLYNRKTQEFVPRHGTEYISTYEDNLALVDKTLGLVNKAIQENPERDRTVLIVTSDHGHKPRSNPVVFIVKFPNDDTAIAHKEQLKTVRLRELVNMIVDGSVASNADVQKFFRKVPGH